MKSINDPTPSIDKFPALQELYSEAHRKKGNLSGTVAGCTGTLAGLTHCLELDLKYNKTKAGAKEAIKTLKEVVAKLRQAREESY